MEMFLWAVGSFHVFGEKLDLTWFYKSESSFLRKTQISSLLARCKVPSSAMWAKAFIFSRKAFIFRRKAFIFWRLPLWRYGGLDSANSANKVG